MNNSEDLPNNGQFQKISLLGFSDNEIEEQLNSLESQGEIICKIKVKEGYVLLLKYPTIPDFEFFEKSNTLNRLQD